MKTDIRDSADELNMSVNHPTNENMDTSMDAMHGFGEFEETNRGEYFCNLADPFR
jgi:hypothetical protein